MIDSSSEGYCIIAGEDIMVGQTIAPLYGNVVSLEAIYDLQRENSNLKISFAELQPIQLLVLLFPPSLL